MWIKFIIILVLGYLLGSFSPAYFIGKYVKDVDLRQKGSGNLGSTNVMRVLGTKSALITFVLDTLKGFLIMYISDLMFSDVYSSHSAIGMLIGGVAVVVGHNFPFYLNFRGGKGIATTFGVALYLNPFGAMCMLLLEWLITLTTGYVSLASVINCIAFPFFVNLIRLDFAYAPNVYTWGLCIILSVIAIVRHIPNIKRLIKGNENRFMLKSTIKEKKPVFNDKDTAQHR